MSVKNIGDFRRLGTIKKKKRKIYIQECKKFTERAI